MTSQIIDLIRQGFSIMKCGAALSLLVLVWLAGADAGVSVERPGRTLLYAPHTKVQSV